ncbi:putative DNA methylase [Neorhodopirellula lusitana]|uniref:DNA methylase n=1 Tax=Neorhodopirellula lusitana TaxID=445327 RepID=A0ABY1QAZ6_9BACT|nr:DUF1156 domain-containing protein [Neorhodopirellula lusitana]SMP61414.1 putative DNA methylase [Neorhodopirellula lusitana]
MPQTTYRKKLIEVALPLEAINTASAREKSIRHGHPSTLHLWWARRPLAACRAVLFSSLVNDPDDDPMYGHDENVAATERAKLFDLIEELVLWENSNNPKVINAARLEIARSIAANKVADKELADDTPLVANAPELPEEQAKYLPDPPPEYTAHDVRFKMPGLKPEQVNHFLAHYAPPVLDPFAGGGSIPLEAQRLGLRAYASDLNPVPVLINKALIEIPPRFAGQPPVNPEAQQGKLATKVYSGAEGLAEDVSYYGKWMRDEAEKRIGHLYPKVKVTQQMVDDGRPDLEPYIGQELTVIGYVWARTVESPNPAYSGRQVPLTNSFWLCTKKGKWAWVEPEVHGDGYTFKVRRGEPSKEEVSVIKAGTKLGRGSNFGCLLSNQPIQEDHIKAEGMAGRIGQRLMATVAVGKRERVFLDPRTVDEETAFSIERPSEVGAVGAELAKDKRALWCLLYGLTTFDKLYSDRQLLAMQTFAQLIREVREQVAHDAATDKSEIETYADALETYLAFAVSKSADYWSNLCTWRSDPKNLGIGHVFVYQALPMAWDFAECNPFSTSSGSWHKNLSWVISYLRAHNVGSVGLVRQLDAASAAYEAKEAIVSTDPPYYDNIGYSDLSDFFYVWLRSCLNSVHPDLFGTMVTPKSDELIASPYRHDGSSEAARNFFEEGLSEATKRLQAIAANGFPVTVYYAFKQSETTKTGETASTGWETMLTGLIGAGFAITGTWPLRTELGNRMIGSGTNALASSIALVCRPRSTDASMVTRRDFANALRIELPEAIKHLQSGNVAPVDLAQASIGPGMAVFSRYSKVVNADGSPMSVREALQLINQVLDESLVEQESDFDAETRFALRWFEQYGMSEGPFGDAETLAKAMAVSVTGIVESGIAASGAGKVRLLKRDELLPDWAPETDLRLTMWEVAQYLIRSLENDGEAATGTLLARIGSSNGEIARELAYRLYQTCEKKKLAEEARAYNGLVVSWPEIVKLSRQQAKDSNETQAEMF